MNRELAGKTALVVGGSSGIGEASAIKLAEAGARVGVVASRDLGKGQRVVSRIHELGGEAESFVADISEVTAIDRLVQEFLQRFRTIDILVNSAGVFYPTVIGEVSEEDFDRMVDINLKGLFYTIDGAAPTMMQQRAGKIVNIASIAGIVGSKEYGLYCAVKAGVIALTKSFALQLAPFEVNVNAIAPGNTATPINLKIRTSDRYEERRKMIDATTPSPTKFSDPADIAEGVLFLASDRSRAMHGTTLLMDQGRAAGL
jgi:3-oxoacyl-[acyl-carrier protein] reductase